MVGGVFGDHGDDQDDGFPLQNTSPSVAKYGLSKRTVLRSLPDFIRIRDSIRIREECVSSEEGCGWSRAYFLGRWRQIRVIRWG